MLHLITLLWCVFFLRAAIRRGQHALQRAATVPLVEECIKNDLFL